MDSSGNQHVTPGRPIGSLAANCLLITGWSAILLLPSLIDGPPVGLDYAVHVTYLDNFVAQMRAGEAYPRWLAGLWDGAGGPDLFFYPPLIYWVGTLLALTLCQGCSCSELFAWSGIFWLSVFGFGLRGLARRYFGRAPALVGALVGMALPYHLGAEWGDRSAYAEFAASSLIPWHLTALLNALAGRRNGMRLTLLTALILLCHIVTALMLAVLYCALLAALWRVANRHAIAHLTAATAAGAGLAAIYWYPAVVLLQTVNAEVLSHGAFRPGDWVLSPAKLILNDMFAVGLVPPFVALCMISLVVLVLGRGAVAEVRHVILVLIAVPALMCSPLAWPLYEFTPLGRIQFPWRFFLIADVGFALVLALAVEAARRNGYVSLRGQACLAGVALIAGVTATENPALRQSRNNNYWSAQELIERSAGYLSWLPREIAADSRFDTQERYLPMLRRLAERPPVELFPANAAGRVAMISSGPRRVVLEADLTASTSVVLRRTYWKFAKLYRESDGMPLTTDASEDFPLTVAVLPAGSDRFVLELPVLREERIAVLISLISLLIVVGWALTGFRRRGRREESLAGLADGKPIDTG